jgi:hypothetical protein
MYVCMYVCMQERLGYDILRYIHIQGVYTLGRFGPEHLEVLEVRRGYLYIY